VSYFRATMTDYAHDRPHFALPMSDLYILLLCGVLLGYALMGKGFAYLGFPPFFIGEIAFLVGALVLLKTGCLVASLATLPSLLLATTMIWVLLRTLPFVGAYGFDALRDSVIVMYGGFGFFVIAILLEDPRRIETLIRYYGVMLASFPAILVGLWVTKYWGNYIPRLYGPVPIVDLGVTMVGTHLAGTMVFALIGYRKVSFLWVLVWMATLALVAATNRGATLAVIMPVAFAMLVLGRFRLMVTTVVAAICIFAALFVVEVTFGEEGEDYSPGNSWERPVSAHQIIENAKSIIGQSTQRIEGTKEWRLMWWEIIINDTIYGPNFWTGRGFGINLADADGFAATGSNPRPPLRSPHNSHITVLARAGVPGVVLWVLVLVSWFAMLMRAMLTARISGQKHWANLFLFIGCYAAAILINATFDVTLEGPTQGIWFWCLFGFGVGSAMIYRAQRFDGFRG
jgi:O-Antigen ligase